MEDLVVIGWRYKKEGERSIVWRPEFKCKPKKKILEAMPEGFWKADRNMPYSGKAGGKNPTG